MHCRGEKLFRRESKIMVRGLRNNVELEKILHERRVHDERDWFALKRETASRMFARTREGGQNAGVGKCEE